MRNAFISIIVVALAASMAFAQDDSGDSGDSGSEEAPEGLAVQEIVLSKALDEGRPVDPGTSFSRSDGQIYATVRVQNPSREATSIKVVMRGAGQERGGHGIELEIPARPRYRTVARFTTRRDAGPYQVIVTDVEGNELSSVNLTITE